VLKSLHLKADSSKTSNLLKLGWRMKKGMKTLSSKSLGLGPSLGKSEEASELRRTICSS
jgi:hypothetical protein